MCRLIQHVVLQLERTASEVVECRSKATILRNRNLLANLATAIDLQQNFFVAVAASGATVSTKERVSRKSTGPDFATRDRGP